MSDIADRFPAGGWEFTPEVTEVFDEHVRASVPYYDDIQAMVAEFSDWLLPDGGMFVDLGASTCTTLETICARHPNRRVRAELYDEEPSMLDRAKEKTANLNVLANFHVQRLQKPFKHVNADLTVALFTLQFLREQERVPVLAEARRCTTPGGAIILAEKIRPQSSLLAEIAMDASHDFKAAAGIPDQAIRSKARALRGVLMPQTFHQLTRQMYEAGWHEVDVVFRWHQWVIVIGFAR
jgi:tRNA (cmo5U34)-methyltransferase